LRAGLPAFFDWAVPTMGSSIQIAIQTNAALGKNGDILRI
jgi:hypothetical protein